MNAKFESLQQTLTDYLRPVELFLFSLVMWTVVGGCFIALATKALIGKPSSVPVHYLLIAITAAASVAVLLPTVLSRIGEISFGGIKLVLAHTETVLNDLQGAFDVPDEDLKLEVEELKGPQRYEYARLSYKLYRIFDQFKDPNSLDRESQKKYRRLIEYVGRAAFRMNHQTKYLTIVLHLQGFKDRPLTWDEQFLIGHAYLAAADDLDVSKRERYWQNSAAFLEAATKINSNEVLIPFHLGMAVLCLGNYRKGIELMKTCIAMSEPISQKAKWNIACGLKKLGQNDEAIGTLEEIPAGELWRGIAEDDWLKNWPPEFADKFKALCESRIREYDERLKTPPVQ